MYSIPRFFEHEMKCSFMNVTELGENHLQYTKTEFHNKLVWQVLAFLLV